MKADSNTDSKAIWMWSRSLVLVAGIFCISACSPVGFDQMKSNDPSPRISFPDTFDPVDPPPIMPPVTPSPSTPPSAVLSKGACAADSSTRLLSCMTCDVPPVVVVPQFSRKGQALFEIMANGCQVRNASDPAGYHPPSRAELMRRLNRLSPTLYPDSQMTEIQMATINSLLTNPQTMQTFFGGIWYSGVTPATRAFETYFGIETIEARYALCYGNGEGISNTFNRFNSTELHSKEWVDCQYSNDPFNCREGREYTAANVYRGQLRRAMNESINNPYVASPSNAPMVCEWEKYEGNSDAAAETLLKTWLATGFKVGAEDSAMCFALTVPPSGLTGKVSLAAYRCK